MTHTEIINSIIKKFNHRSYLEIGVFKGNNFKEIECEYKVGVDPDENSQATYKITSDEFFAENKKEFDCIFIDGSHVHPQPWHDMNNARASLSFGGTIIVHDLNPTSEIIQRVPRETKQWTGDGWKSWLELRSRAKHLEMFVIDTDYGVGIIRKGKGIDFDLTFPLHYDNFKKHRKECLNLISVQAFQQWLHKAKDQRKFAQERISSQG